MKHEISEREGKTVISFEGDMDLDSSRESRKVLLECVGRGRSVLVDLSGVDYIDSSGVASLVESLQDARKRGSDLALVSVSPTALRVLHLARLDKVFTIHQSLEDGLGGRTGAR